MTVHPLAWSVSGADRGKFEIDTNLSAIAFTAAPDYETFRETQTVDNVSRNNGGGHRQRG